MERFVITGGNKLTGTTKVSGAKNAALKVLVAACLTDEEVIIHNVPLIADLLIMIDIMQEIGADVSVSGHTVKVRMKKFNQSSIPMDKSALVRASMLFIGPLLARRKEALIPNPGGCRLGARPIDRIVSGVGKMNVTLSYKSEDGYFHAKTAGLKGTKYHFAKSTHTGTETMIIAAALAEGTTVLTNAAEEPEINDLINLINDMGGNVRRSAHREITIEGVKKLHGTEFTISPDRIEVATFAIAAVITGGDVFVKDAQKAAIEAFLEKYEQSGGGYEMKEDGIRFYYTGQLQSVDVETGVYPAFLTDWQAPWAVMMTQAKGQSIIHETVFENKLGYITDLEKMGATTKLFNPKVTNPEEVYNFNLDDDKPENFHAVKITGPTSLHNAVMTTLDIRAGAAIVLAALIAKGPSTIYGIEKLDRGYEKFEQRLAKLGADIKRIKD